MNIYGYLGLFPEEDTHSLEYSKRLSNRISSAKIGVPLRQERSQEHCKALSKALAGKPKSKEHRKSISDSWKVNYEERCEALRKAAVGKVHYEDPKERSARRQKEWADPDIRARRETSIRLGLNDPEVRSRRSRIQKILWNDPNYKTRVLEAQSKGRKGKTSREEFLLWNWVRRSLPEGWVWNKEGAVVIGGKIPDFINESRKQIIEIFGTYWHDPYLFPNRSTDSELIEIYRKLGYSCVVLWEYDIWLGTHVELLGIFRD